MAWFLSRQEKHARQWGYDGEPMAMVLPKAHATGVEAWPLVHECPECGPDSWYANRPEANLHSWCSRSGFQGGRGAAYCFPSRASAGGHVEFQLGYTGAADGYGWAFMPGLGLCPGRRPWDATDHGELARFVLQRLGLRTRAELEHGLPPHRSGGVCPTCNYLRSYVFQLLAQSDGMAKAHRTNLWCVQKRSGVALTLQDAETRIPVNIAYLAQAQVPELCLPNPSLTIPALARGEEFIDASLVMHRLTGIRSMGGGEGHRGDEGTRRLVALARTRAAAAEARETPLIMEAQAPR